MFLKAMSIMFCFLRGFSGKYTVFCLSSQIYVRSLERRGRKNTQMLYILLIKCYICIGLQEQPFDDNQPYNYISL